MEIKRFKISEDVLTEMVKYLATRPYGEVNNLVLAIQNDVAEAGVEDLERPIRIKSAPAVTEETTKDEVKEFKAEKSKKKK